MVYVFRMHKINVNKPRNRTSTFGFYPNQSIEEHIGIGKYELIFQITDDDELLKLCEYLTTAQTPF